MKYVYVVTKQTAMDRVIHGVYSSKEAVKRYSPKDTIYTSYIVERFTLKTLDDAPGGQG